MSAAVVRTWCIVVNIACPSQFGTYTINVAGINSAGEGEINTTSVVVPESK